MPPVAHRAVPRATRLPVAVTSYGYGNTHTGAHISQQDAAATGKLPAGWSVAKSTTHTGETYYVNDVTGDSQYAMPTVAAGTVPAGWSVAQSTTTGETYYINKNTGYSQYAMPTVAAGTAAEISDARMRKYKTAEAQPASGSKLHLFNHTLGALGAGNDVGSGEYTLHEAATRCLELGAVGFTHRGHRDQQGKVTCYFKSSADRNDDPNWQAYVVRDTAPETRPPKLAPAPRHSCLICSTVVSVVSMTIIIVALVEDGYAATPSEEGSLERCRSAIKPFGVWLKVVFIFLALNLAKGWIARCRGDERCRLEGWPLRLEKLWTCLSSIWVTLLGPYLAQYAEERSCETLDEPPMVYHLVLALTVTWQVLGSILLFGWVCAIFASPVLLLRHAAKEAELTKRVAVLEASMVSGGRVTMAAGKRREEALLLVQKTFEKAGVQTAASQRQRP